MNYKVRFLCTEDHVRCTYQPIVELDTRKVVFIALCVNAPRSMKTKPASLMMFYVVTIEKHGLTWQLDRSVTSKALSELGRHLNGVVNEGCLSRWRSTSSLMI